MGKVYALVTGGTSGMGLEYVKQLASRGYNVIIAALPAPGTPESVAARMKEENPALDFVPIDIDLARVEAASELLSRIREERPDAVIEVLVNNAGVLHPKHFCDLTLKELQGELLLHNLTMASLCRLILPEMKERGRGYVLNVSSLAAWLPYPYISTYCATKSFNRMLTRALRTECRGSGVNVAAIYFGAVDTPLVKLKDSYRTLAKRLHIMTTPDKAAGAALKMLFSGRSGRMPGLLNRLSLLVCPILPRRFLAWVDRKASSLIGR